MHVAKVVWACAKDVSGWTKFFIRAPIISDDAMYPRYPTQ